MKSVSELTNEINGIKEKIESLKAEKADKEKEIDSLKASNIRLIINAADKERKPASISSGVNRITTLLTENEQLSAAIQALEGQQNVLQNELFIAELRQELDTGYYAMKDQYIGKAKSIQNGLKTWLEYGKCLTEQIAEFNLLPNPLMAANLYNIFKRCRTYDQFISLGFDWPGESAHFNLCNGVMADEEKLDKLIVEIKKFSNILYAIEQNILPGLCSGIPHA
ncbi:MAG: hypothetical protein GX654_14185 [Desulfatiglans sp.]|nr:hypothetical protein [Desulfatiglans sp.]